MKRSKIIECARYVLLVAVILLCALFVRISTFWLPHVIGDEIHYLGLAMKLDEVGFEHYNLRGVKFNFINIDPGGKIKLVYYTPTADPEDKGDIISIFSSAGVYYYDEPVFHKPPGFPYMLVLAHKLFGRYDQPYVTVAMLLQDSPLELKTRIFVDKEFYTVGLPILIHTQFYAVIVPLFFSLATILCTFLLGRLLFSYRVGIYAACMVMMHPIAIVTSQKLFADDMLAFCATVSILLYVFAVAREKRWLIFVAGAMCGVGVLAKQTAGYVLIALWIFSVLERAKNFSGLRSLFRIVFNTHFILFAAGVFLVSGWWFVKMYQVYGTPLYQPTQPHLVATNTSGWFKLLRSRPPGWILYAVGIPYLCPLMVLVYCGLKDFVISFKNALCKKVYDNRLLLLWVIIGVFYYMLRGGNEHRRMLPVYPYIALISSYYLDRFRVYNGKCSRFFGSVKVRGIVIGVLIVACACAWSIPIGARTALGHRQLIRIPF